MQYRRVSVGSKAGWREAAGKERMVSYLLEEEGWEEGRSEGRREGTEEGWDAVGAKEG